MLAFIWDIELQSIWMEFKANWEVKVKTYKLKYLSGNTYQ